VQNFDAPDGEGEQEKNAAAKIYFTSWRFSTERATKIWRVFCGADLLGADAMNFSRTNAWSCRQLRGRVGSFGACGKVVYAV
jgi:hypothetical protein